MPSHPTAPHAATVPGPNFLHAVAERLAPLFLSPDTNAEAAQAAAREAIEAHAPQTAADYASIGQIIAFSLAAVSAIAQSAAAGLPPNVQLRFLGRANTLGRSAAQAERIMQQRRKAAQAEAQAAETAATRSPAAKPPATKPLAAQSLATQPLATRSQPAPPRLPPEAEAAILAAIDETVAQCLPHRGRRQLAPLPLKPPAQPSTHPSPRQTLLAQTTLARVTLPSHAT